jgi:hypothetical protein
MQAVDMECKRFLDWIAHDLPVQWKAELRRRMDDLQAARTELSRCLMRTIAGQTPACMEEHIAVRRSEARIREAEEKLALIRKWAEEVNKAIQECQGPVYQLSSVVEGDLEQSLGWLEGVSTRLEEYVSLAPAGAGQDAAMESASVGPLVQPSPPAPQGEDDPHAAR